MSRMDYCNAVFAGSPRYITDKLQCVLNATARLVTGTHKFDHSLSHLLHEELHWLNVPERIHYKLEVTVHRCLQNKATEYLVDCCIPVSDIPSRRHLRSATRHHLTVRTTLPAQQFPSSGLLCRWSEGLKLTPDSLRDLELSSDRRRRTYFVITTQHTQRSRDA